jgi:hypothetical protein
MTDDELFWPFKETAAPKKLKQCTIMHGNTEVSSVTGEGPPHRLAPRPRITHQ